MSKLTTTQRNKLPESKFAGPNRSYPVDTHNRAANAKSRASEMEHKGAISPATKAKIDHAADAVLRRTHGDGEGHWSRH